MIEKENNKNTNTLDENHTKEYKIEGLSRFKEYRDVRNEFRKSLQEARTVMTIANQLIKDINSNKEITDPNSKSFDSLSQESKLHIKAIIDAYNIGTDGYNKTLPENIRKDNLRDQFKSLVGGLYDNATSLRKSLDDRKDFINLPEIRSTLSNSKQNIKKSATVAKDNVNKTADSVAEMARFTAHAVSKEATSVKEKSVDAAKSIGNSFKNAAITAKNKGLDAASAVGTGAKNAAITAKDSGLDAASAVGNGAKNAAITAKNKGLDAASAVGTSAKNAAITAKNRGLDAASAVGTDAKNAAITAKNRGLDAASAVGTSAKNAAITAKNRGLDAASAVGTGAKNAAITAKNKGLDAASAVGTSAKNAAITAKNRGLNAASAVGTSAKNAAITAKNKGLDAASAVGTRAKNAAITAKNRGLDAASAFGTGAKNAAITAKNRGLDAASAVGTGAKNAAIAAINKGLDAATATADAIKDAKESVQEHLSDKKDAANIAKQAIAENKNIRSSYDTKLNGDLESVKSRLNNNGNRFSGKDGKEGIRDIGAISAAVVRNKDLDIVPKNISELRSLVKNARTHLKSEEKSTDLSKSLKNYRVEKIGLLDKIDQKIKQFIEKPDKDTKTFIKETLTNYFNDRNKLRDENKNNFKDDNQKGFKQDTTMDRARRMNLKTQSLTKGLH